MCFYPDYSIETTDIYKGSSKNIVFLQKHTTLTFRSYLNGQKRTNSIHCIENTCAQCTRASRSYQSHLPRTYFPPTFPYGDIFIFPLRSSTLHEITPRLLVSIYQTDMRLASYPGSPEKQNILVVNGKKNGMLTIRM